MSSSILSSAVLYTAAGGFLTGLSKGIAGIFQNLLYRYQISGVVISPCGGKGYIMEHVLSDETLFIDLDPEIYHSLDDDEKIAAQTNNSSLQMNRTVYQKGKEVVKDLIEMINGTTKSIKKICFLSHDYRLLKFIGVSTIYYTIGTQAYYDSIVIPENKKKPLERYQEDLKKNKKTKLIAYTNLTSLLTFITNTYNTKLKI